MATTRLCTSLQPWYMVLATEWLWTSLRTRKTWQQPGFYRRRVLWNLSDRLAENHLILFGEKNVTFEILDDNI
jgi:hypothetical protein